MVTNSKKLNKFLHDVEKWVETKVGLHGGNGRYKMHGQGFQMQGSIGTSHWCQRSGGSTGSHSKVAPMVTMP